MDKVIRDGKVAILYSPGYGAGWYSWNSWCKECIFCPEIVLLIEERDKLTDNKSIIKKNSEIIDMAEKLFNTEDNKFYANAAEDLTISWINEGQSFKINEYDGSESIELKDADDWIVA